MSEKTYWTQMLPYRAQGGEHINVCQQWQLIPPVLFSSANLFLLISSIVGSKMAGPHTQFVQSFMEECVECLEQGSRGSILQFMPFTMVSYELGGEGRQVGDKKGEEWLLRQKLLGSLNLVFILLLANTFLRIECFSEEW